MLEDKTIGILGAGSIAEALVQGVVAAGLVAPQQIVVTNRSNEERLAGLTARFGVRTSLDKAFVAGTADLLVVACKPKDVSALLAEVGGRIRPGQVVLSLAAGVTTASLRKELAPGVHVVRAMPNTSCLVRESATAIAPGAGCSSDALALCRHLLGAVGNVVEVAEESMDAVTGLSGTGPAYIYLVLEAMVAGGVANGLTREVAADLAVQTVIGAARMLQQTGENPAVLRERVTSPGGTTMAGLGVLRDRGFSEALQAAIGRATERSRELGAELALRATS